MIRHAGKYEFACEVVVASDTAAVLVGWNSRLWFDADVVQILWLGLSQGTCMLATRSLLQCGGGGHAIPSYTPACFVRLSNNN